MESPSRAEVLLRLQELAAGHISRNEAAEWAMKYIRADAFPDDDATWAGITNLAKADEENEPSSYVYHEEDFLDWLKNLEKT